MAAAAVSGGMAEFEERVRQELHPDLEVLNRLGGGPLSTVFLAREPALQRLVAVKVLHPRATRRTKAMIRFRREARALARVSHPNVVSIFRVGDLFGETPYLVMQFVRGPSLAQRLAEDGPLVQVEACSVLASIAEALSAVHSHEIVHRDVRPDSVLCSESDHRVMLADFGLAAFLAASDAPAERITTTGHVVTDLNYTAPEFLAGDEPTIASDLYALGILAYHVLTGQGPYDSSTPAGKANAHLREAPVRLQARGLEVPRALQEILDACLEKLPSDRPGASDAALRFEALSGPLEADVSVMPRTRESAPGGPDPGRPAISLQILGGLGLEGGGDRNAASILRQPKRVALLAYLAAGPEGGFRRRDSLIGLFWPESSPESARHSLRQALYVLRREVGADVLRTRGDEEVGVSPDAIECDAARFEVLARAGSPERAMDLYAGDLLPGFYVDDAPEFERWLDVERLRLRRLAASLCWDLVEQATAGGDGTEAARRARQAVDLDPFDEPALHRLIELLDSLGDRAGALAAFDHFARRLSEEYAAEPSPETMKLVEGVRARRREGEWEG